MKKLLALTVVAMFLTPVGNANAHHDEKCLHRNDYRIVGRNALSLNPMSRWQVHQLFEMTGHEVDSNKNTQTRVYEGCGEDSRAWVQYRIDYEGIYRVESTAYTWRYFGDGLTTLQPA
jgi:hypothetical protein